MSRLRKFENKERKWLNNLVKSWLALIGYSLVLGSIVYFLSNTNDQMANELALLILVGGIVLSYPYSLFVNRIVCK